MPTRIKNFLFSIIFSAVLFAIPAIAGSNNGLVYHGRIAKPGGDGLSSGTANFNLKIYGSSEKYWNGTSLQLGPDRCLLYEENQTKNMAGTNGAFELIIGEGSSPKWGTGAGVSDRRLSRIMMNNPLDEGNYIPAISCLNGTGFYFPFGPDPAAPEWVDRELEVTITTGATVLALNPMSIKAQPYAMQAGQVGGFSPQNLFRISGASNLKFTAAQHDFLASSLLPGAGATTRLVGLPAVPVSANEAASKAYVDATLAGAVSGAGGVTSVTGVAPIQSSGGSTPAISISQASGTIPGYLSAADWTSFNNKLSSTTVFAGDISGPYNNITLSPGVITAGNISDGTITFAKLQNMTGPGLIGRGAAGAGPMSEISVSTGLSLSAGGILTATNAGTVTAVTGSGSISSSGGATPIISISTAASGVDGILTSTDWTTFNNKLSAVTGAGVVSVTGGSAISISVGEAYLVGRVNGSGAGPASAISIGGGLEMSAAGVLSASGSGLVASVNGSGSINVTAGSNPVVSVSTAATAVNGILTSTDWNAFNSKIGAISGVGSISTAGNAISISTAATGTNGMLTSTDWNTFNSKLGAISGVGSISTAGGAISISTAATGTDGILSSTDWNAFNNKISASGIQGTGSISFDNSSNAISISTAATGTNGILSSTDWNTFNNKISQITGTGPISVSMGAVPAISISTSGGNGFYVNGGNAFGVNATLGTTDSRPLSFLTNNSPAMSISQSGQVGIGTSSPSNTLQVNGSAGFSEEVNDAFGRHLKLQKSRAGAVVQNGDDIGDIQFQGYTGSGWNTAAQIATGVDGVASATETPGNLKFSTRPIGGGISERMRISAGGQVGINTQTPQALLQIATSSSVPFGHTEVARLTGTYDGLKSGPMLRFSNFTVLGGTNPSAGEYNLAGIAGFDDDNNWGGGLSFKTAEATGGGGNLVERMVIRSSGKVGIGTDDPDESLHVVSAGDVVAKVGPTTSASGNANLFLTGKNTGVESEARIFADWDGGLKFRNGSGAAEFQWQNSGSQPVMTIDAGGRVGIGTTVANTALEVSGSITAGIPGNATGSQAAITLKTGASNSSTYRPIAIKNGAVDSDVRLFADHGNFDAYGIYYRNSDDSFHFTSGNADTDGTLESWTEYYQGGGTDTVRSKFRVKLANGETMIGGNVGIKRATASTALEVSGAIVSDSYAMTGNNVDLSNSNVFVMSAIGSSTINLSNPVSGGTYTLVMTDTTSRTYSTWSGCTNVYYKPGIAATTGATQSIFTLLTVQVGASWNCYVTWATGYQ